MSEPIADHVPLHAVYVCAVCLSGVGGECHVPGCLFWMHDAPTERLHPVHIPSASPADDGERNT